MPIPDAWIESLPPRFFMAGIIQGSLPDAVHDQSYRQRIRDILHAAFPGAYVYCPVDNHPESLGYTFDEGRQVFLDHIEMAATATALIAFVPEASMGTAAEMWESHRRGVPVIAISPLKDNWAIKYISTVRLDDLEAFEDYVARGKLARLLDGRVSESSA